MECDFNNVRRQAINDFNRVVRCVKATQDEFGIDYDLAGALRDLRSDIVGIGACHIPDDPGCVCVLDDSTHVEDIDD